MPSFSAVWNSIGKASLRSAVAVIKGKLSASYSEGGNLVHG